MEMTIKQATNDDVPALSRIAELTFPLAGPVNASKKEIAKYLLENFNETALKKLVENEDVFVACVQTGHELVGLIVMKYRSSCPNIPDLEHAAELQRLYVLPEYHGTNTSNLLVTEVFKACSEKQIDTIWLSVFSENIRAKKFYAKFGFQESGSIHFKMGNETHLDTVMAAKIV